MLLAQLGRPALRPEVVTSRCNRLRRSLFGWSFPTPSNLPLAGTGIDGSGPPFLLIAQVIVGLPTTLWTYKCIMMVLFQRRIIYMPSIPPGMRNESLKEGEMHSSTRSLLGGMNWNEVEVESGAPSRWLRRKVNLKGIEMEAKQPAHVASTPGSCSPRNLDPQAHVVVLYLQGNAGTPLLRLPLFCKLLAQPANSHTYTSTLTTLPPPRLTLLALAPRSFWLSTRSKPTQPSLLADYAAALAFLRREHPDAKVVLYGHSLGGAAALQLVEAERRTPPPVAAASGASPAQPASAIAGVILENPMPSIATMVQALYPQEWLPYHYLGPLAFDRWDALAAMRAGLMEHADVRRCEGGRVADRPPSLWLRSGGDEIIEEKGVTEMFDEYRKGRVGAAMNEEREGPDKWVECPGALHDTAYLDRRWRGEIWVFLERVAGTVQETSEMKLPR